MDTKAKPLTLNLVGTPLLHCLVGTLNPKPWLFEGFGLTRRLYMSISQNMALGANTLRI